MRKIARLMRNIMRNTLNNRRLQVLGAICGLFVWAGAGAAQVWQSAGQGPAGADLNAVFWVEGKRGWMGGDNGYLSRTDDGKTWTPQTSGTDAALNDIFFINKNDGYFLAGGGVWATNDGGATWSNRYACKPQEFGATSAELYSVRFANKKKGWAVGSLSVTEKRKTGTVERVLDSLLLRTEDGGQTWQRWRVPVTDELIHLDLYVDTPLSQSDTSK